MWEKLRPIAREMRAEPTVEEDLLWQRLRNRQLNWFKFRRQHAVDRFIVDFYCAEAKLVIEVDGEIHEHTRERDQERYRILEALGFRVLRIKNADVWNDLDAVLGLIATSANLPLSASGERAGG